MNSTWLQIDAIMSGQRVFTTAIASFVQEILVETLREIAELMIWGDQHEPTFFDFFAEKRVSTASAVITPRHRICSLDTQSPPLSCYFVLCHAAADAPRALRSGGCCGGLEAKNALLTRRVCLPLQILAHFSRILAQKFNRKGQIAVQLLQTISILIQVENASSASLNAHDEMSRSSARRSIERRSRTVETACSHSLTARFLLLRGRM